MQATPLTCPNCGAGLGPLQDGQYHCAYCGHRSLPPQPPLDQVRREAMLAARLAHFESNRARARTARQEVADRARAALASRRRINGWVLIGNGILFSVFAVACFAGAVWTLVDPAEAADAPGSTFGVAGFGLFWALFAAGMIWGGLRYGRAARRDERLRALGLRGRAVVLSYKEGNIRLDGNPGFDLVLRVELQGREPYVVKQHDWVQRSWAVTTGADLPVLVDPARPGDVMVDWFAVE